MDNLQVEYVSINSIKPYHRNAKTHPQEQIEQIKASMLEMGNGDPLKGFLDPIGIWRDTVVEGHGRLLAARELGLDTVPIIRLDELTDEQRRAYALIHNQLTMNSPFEFDTLELELGDIEMDLSGFGFDMLGADEDEEPQEVVEDNYDGEPPAEPKAKRGDIYQLGRHRLMCGDATAITDIEALITGAHIHLALTDPPYGIDVVQNSEVGGGGETHFGGKVGKRVESSNYFAIKGDDTTETAQENYNAIQAKTDNQIIFGGNYFTDFLSPSRCWIVWDKQNTGNFADAELAWASFDKGVKLYHFMWNGLAREGSRAVEGVHRVRPTQKPVGMLAYILNDFSEVGNNVLDCFGGSGSTLMACEQTERNCYMMEYEPHYIDVIIDRWEKFTGEKAVLLNREE